MAFTEAADAMGIDGQHPALKMARGATHLAQSDLQPLAVSDSSSAEKFVDGRVAGEEGKAVSQFEDLLVQAAAKPHARDAKRRLVDQLQSQTRFDAFRALRGPAAYQVPGSQAEQFGDKQPQPGQVSHDLVGEQLPHASLDAFRVARYRLGAFLGGLCFDGGLSIRSVAIEFFFEGRTPR